MSLLAITPYAGSEALVKMTEAMLAAFSETAKGMEVSVVAVNNAAARPIKTQLAWHGHNDTNEGFGCAVNLAIKRELIEAPKLLKTPSTHTHVLVLNNDLEFPDPRWLDELWQQRVDNLVLSPMTDVTATSVAVSAHALDAEPVRAAQVSAFCWLVPVPVILMLRKRFGFELFNPDFTNYGSDDVTGACLRKLYGPQPFKVVRRSFVRHLKAKTANELGVKPGTKELLQRIANYKRARGLA